MSHFTVAASERAFQRLFNAVRNSIHASTSGSKNLGRFSASWSFGFRLQGGTVDLRNDGTVAIKELDVVYDPVSLTLGVDIPEACVGGFCIVPGLFGGCWVRAPKICIFSGNPDIALPINLGGLIQSEISASGRIRTKYYTSPMRAGGASYLDAEDAKQPNEWQFFLEFTTIDLDPIDIADTIGNILDRIIRTVIDGALGWLPGWARDALSWLLGGIVSVVRRILDIPDDVGEWLARLLGTSLGLLNFISQTIANYFASRTPILRIEDPYPIFGYDGSLIPVKVPLLNVGVGVNDREMILTADVGATL